MRTPITESDPANEPPSDTRESRPSDPCAELNGDVRGSVVDRRRIALDLVDHVDAMVAYWNVDRICEFANKAYASWFGKEDVDLIGTSLEALLGPLYQRHLPHIEAAYQGQRQVFERASAAPDGRVRTGLVTYTPDLENGRVRGIFVHVADVTPLKILELELRAAKEKAEHLATHDPLTGLPNRALLMDKVRQALSDADRTKDAVALLSIDLDNFKRINDTCGHSGGDRFLVEVSNRMKRTVRECDTVIRVAGDEFLVVVPGIDSVTHVLNLADRIMAATQVPLDLGESIVLPGLSMGIALYPYHGRTAEALMENADRALYAAKSRGKNCTMLARFENLPTAGIQASVHKAT